MAENVTNATNVTEDVVKVAAKSTPKSVAGAIAGIVEKTGKAEVHAVGAAAVNQAVKAITIARSFVTLTGKDLICYPAFETVDVNGEDKTAIKFVVEVR